MGSISDKCCKEEKQHPEAQKAAPAALAEINKT